MAKMPGATNPITGNKMNMSASGIVSLLFGGLVLWGVAATTQNIGSTLTSKINNRYVDFQPNALSGNEVKVVDNTAVYG